jgi:acetoin utilization protein AcuB
MNRKSTGVVMVFYIHDQGARIQTPVDQLLAQPVRVTNVKSVQPVSRQMQTDAIIDSELAQYRRIAEQHERRRAVYAADIMHQSIISISSDALIDTAWALFAQHRIHHLVVIDEGRLVGIISDRDLLRGSLNHLNLNEKNLQQRVADVMSRPVLTAAPDTEIRMLAEVMVRQRIGVMPIVVEVNDRESVAGIITRSDLLQLIVDSGPLELWI